MFLSELVVIPRGHPQDVDPLRAPTDAIFKQGFFREKNCSYCLDSLVQSLYSATKDSAGLTLSLFLVYVVKVGSAIGWSCGVVSASSCCMSDKVKG